jgi:hypothetical protein
MARLILGCMLCLRRFGSHGLLRPTGRVRGNNCITLIEGPPLRFQAVYVGTGQKSRMPAVVVGVAAKADAVTAPMQQGLQPGLRSPLTETASLFGDCPAAERIGDLLTEWLPRWPPIRRLPRAAC